MTVDVAKIADSFGQDGIIPFSYLSLQDFATGTSVRCATENCLILGTRNMVKQVDLLEKLFGFDPCHEGGHLSNQ